MAKTFKGRPVVAGSVTARALVSHGGFNTLASFQKSLLAKKTTAVCSDQNNADLYGKVMTGTALCLPQTIGSTTGGMVLHTAAAMGAAPAACSFPRPSIRSPARAPFSQTYGRTTASPPWTSWATTFSPTSGTA